MSETGLTSTAASDRTPTSIVVGVVSAARREVVLATAALGLVGLHALDDNLLQPQPGTSAADHLVSGLVPLAALAAAAAYYGRLRAGLRGAIALLAGFYGVLAGTEAAYYASAGAFSGDDYTGVLSLLSGFVLLGVGSVTLWRSRRKDGGAVWRYTRRALTTLGVVALAGIVLFPTAIAYVVTHTAPVGVPVPNLGATPEDVAFTTSDGLRLEGWFVPSRNGATVIVFPGRSGPQKQARVLIRHGYGVLLFDRRGAGASEGDPNMFGWVGDRDLHAAVEYLRGRADVDRERIGGMGFSVGGEMMIHAAAHSDAFRAIVSEGGSGQSFRDAYANSGLFDAIAGNLPVTLATALFTNTLPPPSLESEMPKIAPNAVFLVYGEKGQGGSERMPNKSFYAAASEPKQIWEVPNGQHIAGITTEPAQYERRVIAFFDHALLER